MKAENFSTDTALCLAVETLGRPLKDRPRWLHIHGQNLLLIDDSGGECIESFDDATALHFFLLWLRHRRAERMREAATSARRASLKVIHGDGGER